METGRNGQKFTETDRKQTVTNRNGQKWTETDRNRQKRMETDISRQKGGGGRRHSKILHGEVIFTGDNISTIHISINIVT